VSPIHATPMITSAIPVLIAQPNPDAARMILSLSCLLN